MYDCFKIILKSIILLSLITFEIRAQQQVYNSIRDSQSHYYYGSVSTIDSSIVSCGCVPGLQQGIISKINANGKIEWSTSLSDGESVLNLYDLAKSDDESFVITGSQVNKQGSSLIIMRIAANGKLRWCKRYNLLTYIQAYGIIGTYDHGFIVTGEVFLPDSHSEYNQGGIIMKVDSVGTPLWSRQIIYPGRSSWFTRSTQCTDSSLLIIGRLFSFYPRNSENTELFHFSSSGDIIDKHNYSSSDSSEDIAATSIIQLRDGSIMISGTKGGLHGSMRGDVKPILFHLSDNNKIEWIKEYDFFSFEIVRRLVQIHNGNIIGSTETFTGVNRTGHLFSIDSGGELQTVTELNGEFPFYSTFNRLQDAAGSYAIVSQVKDRDTEIYHSEFMTVSPLFEGCKTKQVLGAQQDIILNDTISPYYLSSMLPSSHFLSLITTPMTFQSYDLCDSDLTEVKTDSPLSKTKLLANMVVLENPFATETEIAFDCGETVAVQFEIFDILGNRYCQADRVFNKGRNILSVLGKDIPHGQLYGRFSTPDGTVLTIKLRHN